jgi:hypothetical protein
MSPKLTVERVSRVTSRPPVVAQPTPSRTWQAVYFAVDFRPKALPAAVFHGKTVPENMNSSRGRQGELLQAAARNMPCS